MMGQFSEEHCKVWLDVCVMDMMGAEFGAIPSH